MCRNHCFSGTVYSTFNLDTVSSFRFYSFYGCNKNLLFDGNVNLFSIYWLPFRKLKSILITVSKHFTHEFLCLHDIFSMKMSVIDYPLMIFMTLYLLTVRKCYKTIILTFREHMEHFLRLAIHSINHIANNQITMIFPPISC